MDILYKNYKITANDYSWELFVSKTHTKDTKTSKAGSKYWVLCGYYVNLDTLLNKMMRMEIGTSKDVTQLSDYIILWYDIVKNFSSQCKIMKENG